MIKVFSLSSIPHSAFIKGCILANLFLDLLNMIFIHLEGAKHFVTSPKFTHALHIFALKQNIELDNMMVEELQAVFQSTIIQVSWAVVFVNLFFYAGSWLQKKWGYQYLVALVTTGALLSLFSVLEIFTKHPWWAFQYLLQTLAYLYLSYWLIKRRSEKS